MKHVIVGVSERVYARLLLTAQADGKGLTDWVRAKLGVENLERLTDDQFDASRKHVDVERARRESKESNAKARTQAYIVKEWRSVRKRRVVEFRTAPYPEFDAIMHGERDKAGQYLLRIYKERRAGSHVSTWVLDIEESRTFYRSLKLYKKAVNRALGSEHFKMAKKAPAPPQPAAQQATANPVP